MTFGQIKSLIEKNLLESYKNEADFKKSLREFKHNVLNNKSISKVYNLYDQLSTPQGLTESEAKEFLEEGVNLLQRILPSIKMPKSLEEEVNNNYSDIDTLVYTKKIGISERIKAKKNIVETLKGNKNSIKESINIPVTSMVKIANQTLRNYIETDIFVRVFTLQKQHLCYQQTGCVFTHFCVQHDHTVFEQSAVDIITAFTF